MDESYPLIRASPHVISCLARTATPGRNYAAAVGTQSGPEPHDGQAAFYARPVEAHARAGRARMQGQGGNPRRAAHDTGDHQPVPGLIPQSD